MNEISYSFHYRDLDSTELYAHRAFDISSHYDAGKAEALNNLAFVRIASMDYQKAAELLDSAINITDNQIELLVAEIQYLRLCQRQSRNKQFYFHQEKAKRYFTRIDEEKNLLNAHQLKRFNYAESEYYIISSAYYYYVGLEEPSIEMMSKIDPDGDIQKDTAQYLNYLYNVGAGGIITGSNGDVVASEEFGYLTKCYLLAKQKNYCFWQAQSLQAISQHLLSSSNDTLKLIYGPFINYLNVDNISDSLLAGNLAQRSLEIFINYNDVYQVAGAYRTLASCYWQIKDYQSALICLNNALMADTIINRAPDLVASIREQLCLAYSAINDKLNSDINRNYYLDLQEQTRQDKQLEARVDQLDTNAKEMNFMILAIMFLIALLVYILFYFTRKRKRQDNSLNIDTLLAPLKQWNKEFENKMEEAENSLEEIQEQTQIVLLSEEKNKRRNIEQRAKLALINSITPFIDRIINELSRLKNNVVSEELRKERIEYISELSDVINEYNCVITRWIQLQQGLVSIKVESFSLSNLFDIVSKAKMNFKLRGIDLIVEPTNLVVKADKALTLFMINTIADNAKKFTPSGGRVMVKALENTDNIEIRIEDTGCGMTEDCCNHIFDNKHISDDGSTRVENHGFGLLNCKGIIENYKKTSKIFSVCSIDVESKVGKGSRFSFTLPKGIAHTIACFCIIAVSMSAFVASAFAKQNKYSVGRNTIDESCIKNAARYADSAYYSNLNGTYARTISFADSCIKYLNLHKEEISNSKTRLEKMMLYTESSATPAEISWFHHEVKTDYSIILDIRNETAVASLALHEWNLYQYNNKVYTRLFHECFADASLPHYVRSMEKAENNKSIAIVILILLLASIPPVYYLAYYRHIIYYRTCVEKIHSINDVLLSDISDTEKLQYVQKITKNFGKLGISVLDNVVNDIMLSLRHSADSAQVISDKIDFANDNLRRVERENSIIYVSNSVLDNCLSALKHETMYFPSRIKQLIENGDADINVVSEVAVYYKQLYSLLSAQAFRQIETPFKIDNDSFQYLFDLLKKSNGGMKPQYTCYENDDVYSRLAIVMSGLKLNKLQQQNLFTPLTIDINFLICRQIIRELGEYTNMRGCGIVAISENTIEITIPTKIWNSLTL